MDQNCRSGRGQGGRGHRHMDPNKLIPAEFDKDRDKNNYASVASIKHRHAFYDQFKLYLNTDGTSLLSRDRTKRIPQGVARYEPYRLNAKQTELYKRNPHLHQVWVHKNILEYNENNENGVLTQEDRIANPQFQPGIDYQRRAGHVKSVEHWGQRKLLMSEIEFLTNHLDVDTPHTIVYAGSAPGTHIPYLVGLFPGHTWILVDPAKFNYDHIDEDVIIRNNEFTDALAEEYASSPTKPPVLFICDVRDIKKDSGNEEIESAIKNDMERQQRWVKIIRPKAAMLKFRLPYVPVGTDSTAATDYLAGDIHLPVWCGRTSTETRLIVTDPGLGSIKYNHKQYESYMFHHNTKRRVTYFEHPFEVPKESGLDHCYDCASEIFILIQYLRKHGEQQYGEDDGDERLRTDVLTMSEEVTGQCASHDSSHPLYWREWYADHIVDVERIKKAKK